MFKRRGFVVSCVIACSLAGSGCYYTGTHGIVRCWADFNSLNRPAIFVEEVDHWRYSHDRVAYFNSLYGHPQTLAESSSGTGVEGNSPGELAVPDVVPMPHDELPAPVYAPYGTKQRPSPERDVESHDVGPTAAVFDRIIPPLTTSTWPTSHQTPSGNTRSTAAVSREPVKTTAVPGAWLFSRP